MHPDLGGGFRVESRRGLLKVGYSPERINPGDKVHTLVNTVKIVSGCDAEALETISEVYKLVVQAGGAPCA